MVFRRLAKVRREINGMILMDLRKKKIKNTKKILIRMVIML